MSSIRESEPLEDVVSGIGRGPPDVEQATTLAKTRNVIIGLTHFIEYPLDY
jgi:hypothetical protein